MNAQELFTKAGKPAGVYYCEKCGSVDKHKDHVDSCCLCRYCGKPIEDTDRDSFRSHTACWYAHSRETELKKLAEAELVENYTGPFYSIDGWGNDGFIWDDPEELLSDNVESLDRWPEFLFCCEPEPFASVSVSDIVEQCADQLYEDAYDDITVPESLPRAIDEFNEANKDLKAWRPDYSRKVKVGPPPKWLVEEMQEEKTDG